MGNKVSAKATIQDIKRKTRKKYTAEEKIRIVLEGLRGEVTIAELCRKEGINQNLYYRWSKDFLEAGKKRLAGDMAREALAKGSRWVHGTAEIRAAKRKFRLKQWWVKTDGRGRMNKQSRMALCLF